MTGDATPNHVLRMRSTSNIAQVDGSGEWEDLIATRKFAGEDWGKFNRISLWVYPDVVGAPAISCSLVLHNDGAHKLPDHYNEGRHESIILKNHTWNQIVWEIAPLDRDRVTALEFAYSLPKKLPDPGDRTILDVAHLELQSVMADHVEGWNVAPGKIAFSHSGYATGSSKSAIASDLTASQFSLIDQQSGQIVLTKAIQQVTTELGKYQVLDFSEVRQSGNYAIRAGDTLTRPFRIGDDAWKSSLWKAINFMYSERCGTEIPGIHGRCHQDIYTSHGDERIVVNGGYHDAGDLSATGHTPAMAYAAFSLAQSLKRQGEDPDLTDRLLEEARWGLNWVLKTRFGDGYRSTGQLVSYWTDGIMGTADDRHGEAVNNPEWNFRASALEALASRVLRDSDPELANRSLVIAEEDWKYAVEGLKTAAPLPEVYGASDNLELLSFGVVASVDSWPALRRGLHLAEAPFRAELHSVHFAPDFVASLMPWMRSISGKLEVEGKADGTLGKPTLKGTVSWTDGALGIIGFGLYQNIQLHASASNDRFDIQQLSAKVQGGTVALQLAGERAASGFNVTGALRTVDFPVVFDDQLWCMATLTADLSGTARLWELNLSQVNVAQAELQLPEAKRKNLQGLSAPPDVILTRHGVPLDADRAARALALDPRHRGQAVPERERQRIFSFAWASRRPTTSRCAARTSYWSWG